MSASHEVGSATTHNALTFYASLPFWLLLFRWGGNICAWHGVRHL